MKIDVAKINQCKDVRNVYVPIEVQDFIIQLLQVNGKRTCYFKTCCTCINFKKDTEICTLANMRPPAEVIANACPKYIDEDDIPF